MTILVHNMTSHEGLSTFPEPDPQTGQEVDRFTFIPYAQQKGPQKRHTLLFPFDFSECAFPNKTLSPDRIDYTFGWGINERLEVVATNVPVISTNRGQIVPNNVAARLENHAQVIRRAWSFKRPEDLQTLESFYGPDDIAKIHEFSEVVRQQIDRFRKHENDK